MVEIVKPYLFDGAEGKVSLLDLFDGRRQLILYHFMFAPSICGWPDAGCDACSWYADRRQNVLGAIKLFIEGPLRF